MMASLENQVKLVKEVPQEMMELPDQQV